MYMYQKNYKNVLIPSSLSPLVTDFSKKTGDYQSLSAVDLRLIALTYQLEGERGTQGGAHLRTDPIHTNKEQQVI